MRAWVKTDHDLKHHSSNVIISLFKGFFYPFNAGNCWFLFRHILCCMEWAPQDGEYRDSQFLPIPANQPAQSDLFWLSACPGWAGSEYSARGLPGNGEVWWAARWGTVFTELSTDQTRRYMEGGIRLLSIFGPIIAIGIMTVFSLFHTCSTRCHLNTHAWTHHPTHFPITSFHMNFVITEN